MTFSCNGILGPMKLSADNSAFTKWIEFFIFFRVVVLLFERTILVPDDDDDEESNASNIDNNNNYATPPPTTTTTTTATTYIQSICNIATVLAALCGVLLALWEYYLCRFPTFWPLIDAVHYYTRRDKQSNTAIADDYDRKRNSNRSNTTVVILERIRIIRSFIYLCWRIISDNLMLIWRGGRHGHGRNSTTRRDATATTSMIDHQQQHQCFFDNSSTIAPHDDSSEREPLINQHNQQSVLLQPPKKEQMDRGVVDVDGKELSNYYQKQDHQYQYSHHHHHQQQQEQNHDELIDKSL